MKLTSTGAPPEWIKPVKFQVSRSSILWLARSFWKKNTSRTKTCSLATGILWHIASEHGSFVATQANNLIVIMYSLLVSTLLPAWFLRYQGMQPGSRSIYEGEARGKLELNHTFWGCIQQDTTMGYGAPWSLFPASCFSRWHHRLEPQRHRIQESRKSQLEENNKNEDNTEKVCREMKILAVLSFLWGWCTITTIWSAFIDFIMLLRSSLL